MEKEVREEEERESRRREEEELERRKREEEKQKEMAALRKMQEEEDMRKIQVCFMIFWIVFLLICIFPSLHNCVHWKIRLCTTVLAILAAT